MANLKSREARWKNAARRLILAGCFLAVTSAAPARAVAPDFGQTVSPTSTAKLTFYDIKKKSDLAVLNKAFTGCLAAFGNAVPLPKEVIFINDPIKGPVYIDGTIHAKFPLYVLRDDGSVKTKTAAESVALPLHELTHQLFESYLTKNYLDANPPVFWAFFTRMDPMGEEQSRQLIESTKAKAGLAGAKTEDLLNQYFDMSVEATPFNELVADVLPILYLGDPEAFYKNAAFGDADSEYLVHYRRFDMKITAKDIQAIAADESEYDATVLTKLFAWRELRTRLKDGRLQMSYGQMADHFMKAVTDTFIGLTGKFTSGRLRLCKDPVKLNKALIGSLCREFAIEPCEAPQIGRIDWKNGAM